MATFQLLGDAEPRPVAEWTPPIAGLATAALIAYFACPAPRPYSLSCARLITTALAYSASIALSAGLITRLGYAVSACRRGVDVGSIVRRTTASAIWFGPLTFFIGRSTIWTAVAGVALAASLTRLLRDFRRLFGQASSRRTPRLYSAIGIALCGETAIIAGHAGKFAMASILFGIAATVLTWRLYADSASEATSRSWISLAVATLLLTGGLSPYLEVVWHWGAGSPSFGSAEPARFARHSPGGGASLAGGGIYAGVILWPKRPERARLVSPPRPLSQTSFAVSPQKPVRIPFDGAYWFFQAPDKAPPPDSFVIRDDVATRWVRSANHEPLTMEAQQSFGRLIDMSCCSRIQITVANADRYPGTVSMELILSNTSVKGRPSQSLGAAEVNSIPRRGPRGRGVPVEETLTFSIPATAAITQFDAAAIRFHLDAPRTDVGAQIAILGFVLVPRGL